MERTSLAAGASTPAASDPATSATPAVAIPALTVPPCYELEIPLFACAATTLAVTITGIENPAMQPFAVRASLGIIDVPELVLAEIGRVTPRVADSAGTYLLALPQLARELLAQRDGRLRLRLRLQPSFGGAAFSPGFKVRVATPRWY